MNSLNSKWLQEAYSCHGLKKYVENMPVLELQPQVPQHTWVKGFPCKTLVQEG